ncbi:hypothetical protein RAS1_14990 [Phycisphaerae bacterium RAS1]|nr:hypothetical protein RAS1_14990 [Phycisphaerae bacterium RAS1]
MSGGVIARYDPNPIFGADGTMQMRVLPGVAGFAAAKAAFTKSSRDSLYVSFEYLFRAAPPGTYLTVSLSDNPAAGQDNVLVATLYPPDPAAAPPLPGSVTINPPQYALFSGEFPRGTLDLSVLTYVELRLYGSGQMTELWIDDWDPVDCVQTNCGDIGTPGGVDRTDYLYLLSQVGRSSADPGGPATTDCLDGYSRDGYLDAGDILAFDSVLHDTNLNVCADNGSALAPVDSGGGERVNVPYHSLVIAGKSTATGDDQLNFLRYDESCIGSALPPGPAGNYGQYRGNGRLLSDPAQQLYQVHTHQGIIRLSDVQAIVPPRDCTFAGKRVRVGMRVVGQGVDGIPIADAVFHPTDPNRLYVVPVLVTDAGQTYRAAARLVLTAGGGVCEYPYRIDALYGSRPIAGDGCTNTVPPNLSVCDVSRMREIEIDATGQYLFVTAAKAENNNDWVLCFRENNPTDEKRFLLTALNPQLVGPAGLLYARANADRPESLYVASASNPTANMIANVYRLTIQRSSQGGPVTGLSHTPTADVLAVQGMTQVTSILQRPGDHSLWILGYHAEAVEPNDVEFGFSDPLFTTPALASAAVTDTSAAASDLICQGIGLPLSAALSIRLGDMDCDGAVNVLDINPFIQALVNPAAYAAAHPLCDLGNGDINRDGNVDVLDINPFVALLQGG